MFEQFGVVPWKFFTQSAIYFIPAIWATIRVARASAVNVPLWLLLIWLVPVIGPIIAIFSVTVFGQPSSTAESKISAFSPNN